MSSISSILLPAVAEYRAAPHRQRRAARRCGAWLAILLLLAAAAQAAEIEGVRFAPSLRMRETTLALHGVGLMRFRWIIKAYVAALYLEPGVTADAMLDDVPRRLEIHYFHSIDGEDFGPAADTTLRGSLDAATLERLAPRIAAMNALYEDVVPGDRYALTYLPGIGTELSKNGVPRGTIPGADFAAAYFSIWLGEKPIDRDLRDQLVEGL
jgi:hypothetical protein